MFWDIRIWKSSYFRGFYRSKGKVKDCFCFDFFRKNVSSSSSIVYIYGSNIDGIFSVFFLLFINLICVIFGSSSNFECISIGYKVTRKPLPLRSKPWSDLEGGLSL